MATKKVLFTSHTANFSKFNRPFMRWFKEQGYQVHYASAGQKTGKFISNDCGRIIKQKSRLNLNKWWLHPLFLLILGGPLLDIASYLSQDHSTSASGVVRVFLLVVMFIVFLRAPNSTQKMHYAYALIAIMAFFVLQVGVTGFDGIDKLFYQFMRMWYFPIFLVMLLGTKLAGADRIPTVLLVALSAYASVIVLAMLFGNSLYTYDNDFQSGGAVGWFISGNQISAILAIGATLAAAHFASIRFRYIKAYYMAPILIYFVAPIIGTKVAVGGCVIGVVAILFYYFRHRVNSALSITRLLVLAAVLVISFVSSSLLQDFAVRNVAADTPVASKKGLSKERDNAVSAANTETDFIKSIRSRVFSGRIWFLEQRFSDFKQGSILRILFGRGDYSDGTKVRIVEMDLFDIIFANGIVGFVIYIYVIFTPIRRAFIRPWSAPGGYQAINIYALRIGLLLSLVISVFAGHILVAPAVSVMLVGMIYYLVKHENNLHARGAAG